MGFLSSVEVIECSASDLVGEYIGHTGPKTLKMFEKALGRVLFVDEAYRLGEGQFAKEAMDEIVGILTQEKFQSKMIVVLAGYDREMNDLLAVNSGLSSRFPEEIIFQNISPPKCLDIIRKSLEKQNILVDAIEDSSSMADKHAIMLDLLQQLSQCPGWGNGRDCNTLAKQMMNIAFTQPTISSDPNQPILLSAEVAITCMYQMLVKYQERATRTIQSQSRSRHNHLPMQSSPFSSQPPPMPDSSSSSTAGPPPTISPPSPDNSETDPTNIQGAGDQRDPGVSDVIWEQLQRDKKAAEEALKREQEEAERRRKELEEAQRLRAEAEAARQRARDEAARQEALRRIEAARKKAEELERARKLQEERRKEEARVQTKLRHMGLCPQGFVWHKQDGGYRCGGGAHWVPDAQLK